MKLQKIRIANCNGINKRKWVTLIAMENNELLLNKEKIVKYYSDAVNTATIDPGGSVNKIRKGAEAICKILLNSGRIPYKGKSGLYKFICLVTDNELWPDERMEPIIRSIMQIANYGSHDNEINAVDYVRADVVAAIIAYRRLVHYIYGKNVILTDFDLGDLSNMKPIPKQVPFKIAKSKLTVIECILKNWEARTTFQAYGFKREWSEKIWNDNILMDLSNGELDMAIYNKSRIQRYNAKVTKSKQLHILRDVCSSMGGRNFYILASKDGIYNHFMTAEEFKDSLCEVTNIAISKESDRFDNFLNALGLSIEELEKRKVNIINVDCDMGLDYFKFDPNILMVGGQDVRMWAEKTQKYVEVINYESFSLEKKKFLYEQSINSLVVGETGYQKLIQHNAESMVDTLMLNFYRNISNISSSEKLFSELAETIKAKGADQETIDYILRRILFETYRIQI